MFYSSQIWTHINVITSKARSTLGFIKRFCYDIRDKTTIKTLFNTLVRSILEYCCTVWMPYDHDDQDDIERIQTQLTQFILREYATAANNFEIPPYVSRLERLDMIKLDRRRYEAVLMFFFDLMNDRVHCPQVKNIVIERINQHSLRAQQFEKFRISNSVIRLKPQSSLNQMCKLANIVRDLFDQATSRTNFKTLITSSDRLYTRLKPRQDP